MEERHLLVQRTARYHTLGDPGTARAIWIVLHGYGHLARYFLNTFEGLEEQCFIAAPEGLSRFYLDKGHTRVGATWMTREDREVEMADQYAYLDALAQTLKLECPAQTPVRCLGFSQGVATASRWAMHGITTIDELVLWGGGIPPELDRNALGERWKNTRIHLVHGEQDPITPEATLLKNEALLRSARIECAVHRFEGAHALDRLLLGRLLRP